MENENPEVEAAEQTAENTEAAESVEPAEEAAPETDPAEDAAAAEEAALAAEAEAKEKEKEKKIKRINGILLNVLYILLVLVILFEAGAVYLWLNFDSLVETLTGQQSEQTAQPAIQSSSYANWTGTYRPAEWPDAVDIFVDAPPYALGSEPASDTDTPAP